MMLIITHLLCIKNVCQWWPSMYYLRHVKGCLHFFFVYSQTILIWGLRSSIWWQSMRQSCKEVFVITNMSILKNSIWIRNPFKIVLSKTRAIFEYRVAKHESSSWCIIRLYENGPCSMIYLMNIFFKAQSHLKINNIYCNKSFSAVFLCITFAFFHL